MGWAYKEESCYQRHHSHPSALTTHRNRMELSKRGFALALILALLISLLAPEVEGASKRGNRGRALANRGAGVRSRGLQGRLGRLKGGKKGKGRGRKGRRRARKVKRRRTGRWEEGDPPMDAAPLEDNAAAADPGALDAAAAAGEDAGVCEVIMFDRGEGTYSLKFVQNAC